MQDEPAARSVRPSPSRGILRPRFGRHGAIKQTMPIKIPDDLPARSTLDAEGVMVMREADAVRQDVRPCASAC